MARVVVIGGANVDVKGRTTARAIAGTSNPGTVTTSAGGVGRNIAHNLALLGVDVALVAMIGNDANAGVIESQSRAAGVDTSLLQRTEGASGTYLAMLDRDGELISAINAMACADAMTVAMLERLAPSLRAANFLVADCNIPEDCLAWVSHFAAREEKRLLIEPVSVPKSAKLKRISNLKAFAITPNRDQAEALSGTRHWIKAAKVIHHLGIENIVIHAGAEGAFVSVKGISPLHVPACAFGEVRDVTGAGDAAVAGLVWGLVSGYDMIEAVRFGQKAAAIKVQSTQSVADVLTRDALLSMGAGD
jgi:pseudouridine kinase